MIRKLFATKTLTAAATLALGLATTFGACAADAPASVPNSQAAAKSGHVPMLWKVSDKNNTLYLLGSFHLLRKDDLPLSADVDAAMNDAKTTIFETNVLSFTSPEVVAKIQQYQQIEAGKTLSGILPEATRQKLDALLKLGGSGIAQVDGVDAWALSIGMQGGAMSALGFSGDYGPDRLLSERADKAGKPRLALETVDDELRALDGQPMDEQILGLQKFLDNPKLSIERAMQMHGDWMRGDVDGLSRDYLQQVQTETPGTYRLLVVDRNNAWLPKLKERLDAHGAGDNTLAVVGALHLIGKDGLVEQLRAAGYRVERVCSDCAR